MRENSAWVEWRSGLGSGAKTSELVVSASTRAHGGDGDGGLDGGSLIRFVLASRLDLLAERRYDRAVGGWVPAEGSVFNRARMERELGYARRDLSAMLGPSGKVKGAADVQRLEHALLGFALKHRDADVQALRAGWLTSFYNELGLNVGVVQKVVALAAARTGVQTQYASLARWHADLCEAGPHNTAEALVLGEALLALLSAVPEPDLVQQHYTEPVNHTARGLVAVACKPPSGGATPAIQLAAQLGRPVLPIVENHLRHSGVGFRALRILTRMLFLVRTGIPPWWSKDGEAELKAIRQLLDKVDASAVHDPYPARSFHVEAMREAGRVAEARGDTQWLSDVTRWFADRVAAEHRPLRERMYATYCLWERSPESRARLIDECRTRSDSDRGWGYMADVLGLLASDNVSLEELLLSPGTGTEHIIELRVVQTHLAEAGADEDGALTFLDRLPRSVKHAAGQLIRYALLSPDGSVRRRACETLREAGVGREASGVAAGVLLDDRSPRWLQEVSAFVIGYLEDAADVPTLAAVSIDTGRHPTVRHAALFALGDLRFRTNEAIDAAITAMADADLDVRRAAVYALGTLRAPAGSNADANPATEYRWQEQRQRLRTLSVTEDEDPLIRKLGEWGAETMERSAHRRTVERRRQLELWGLDPVWSRPPDGSA